MWKTGIPANYAVPTTSTSRPACIAAVRFLSRKPKGERPSAYGVTFRGVAARRRGFAAPLPSEIGAMFPVGAPLLIVPFALYNILVFFMPGFSWNNEIWRVYMISGGEWGITPGDVIIAGSVLILLIDMLKSARRAGRRTITDHVLAMILFVGMLIEFMTVKAVVSST